MKQKKNVHKMTPMPKSLLKLTKNNKETNLYKQINNSRNKNESLSNSQHKSSFLLKCSMRQKNSSLNNSPGLSSKLPASRERILSTGIFSKQLETEKCFETDYGTVYSQKFIPYQTKDNLKTFSINSSIFERQSNHSLYKFGQKRKTIMDSYLKKPKSSKQTNQNLNKNANKNNLKSKMGQFTKELEKDQKKNKKIFLKEFNKFDNSKKYKLVKPHLVKQEGTSKLGMKFVLDKSLKMNFSSRTDVSHGKKEKISKVKLLRPNSNSFKPILKNNFSQKKDLDLRNKKNVNTSLQNFKVKGSASPQLKKYQLIGNKLIGQLESRNIDLYSSKEVIKKKTGNKSKINLNLNLVSKSQNLKFINKDSLKNSNQKPKIGHRKKLSEVLLEKKFESLHQESQLEKEKFAETIEKTFNPKEILDRSNQKDKESFQKLAFLMKKNIKRMSSQSSLKKKLRDSIRVNKNNKFIGNLNKKNYQKECSEIFSMVKLDSFQKDSQLDFGKRIKKERMKSFDSNFQKKTSFLNLKEEIFDLKNKKSNQSLASIQLKHSVTQNSPDKIGKEEEKIARENYKSDETKKQFTNQKVFEKNFFSDKTTNNKIPKELKQLQSKMKLENADKIIGTDSDDKDIFETESSEAEVSCQKNELIVEITEEKEENSSSNEKHKKIFEKLLETNQKEEREEIEKLFRVETFTEKKKKKKKKKMMVNQSEFFSGSKQISQKKNIFSNQKSKKDLIDQRELLNFGNKKLSLRESKGHLLTVNKKNFRTMHHNPKTNETKKSKKALLLFRTDKKKRSNMQKFDKANLGLKNKFFKSQRQSFSRHQMMNYTSGQKSKREKRTHKFEIESILTSNKLKKNYVSFKDTLEPEDISHKSTLKSAQLKEKLKPIRNALPKKKNLSSHSPKNKIDKFGLKSNFKTCLNLNRIKTKTENSSPKFSVRKINLPAKKKCPPKKKPSKKNLHEQNKKHLVKMDEELSKSFKSHKTNTKDLFVVSGKLNMIKEDLNSRNQARKAFDKKTKELDSKLKKIGNVLTFLEKAKKAEGNIKNLAKMTKTINISKRQFSNQIKSYEKNIREVKTQLELIKAENETIKMEVQRIFEDHKGIVDELISMDYKTLGFDRLQKFESPPICQEIHPTEIKFSPPAENNFYEDSFSYENQSFETGNQSNSNEKKISYNPELYLDSSRKKSANLTSTEENYKKHSNTNSFDSVFMNVFSKRDNKNNSSKSWFDFKSDNEKDKDQFDNFTVLSIQNMLKQYNQKLQQLVELYILYDLNEENHNCLFFSLEILFEKINNQVNRILKFDRKALFIEKTILMKQQIELYKNKFKLYTKDTKKEFHSEKLIKELNISIIKIRNICSEKENELKELMRSLKEKKFALKFTNQNKEVLCPEFKEFIFEKGDIDLQYEEEVEKAISYFAEKLEFEEMNLLIRKPEKLISDESFCELKEKKSSLLQEFDDRVKQHLESFNELKNLFHVQNRKINTFDFNSYSEHFFSFIENIKNQNCELIEKINLYLFNLPSDLDQNNFCGEMICSSLIEFESAMNKRFLDLKNSVLFQPEFSKRNQLNSEILKIGLDFEKKEVNFIDKIEFCDQPTEERFNHGLDKEFSEEKSHSKLYEIYFDKKDQKIMNSFDNISSSFSPDLKVFSSPIKKLDFQNHKNKILFDDFEDSFEQSLSKQSPSSKKFTIEFNNKLKSYIGKPKFDFLKETVDINEGESIMIDENLFDISQILSEDGDFFHKLHHVLKFDSEEKKIDFILKKIFLGVKVQIIKMEEKTKQFDSVPLKSILKMRNNKQQIPIFYFIPESNQSQMNDIFSIEISHFRKLSLNEKSFKKISQILNNNLSKIEFLKSFPATCYVKIEEEHSQTVKIIFENCEDLLNLLIYIHYIFI